jgi:hypothetical protein
MSIEIRGKRRIANNLLKHWVVLSVVSLVAIIWGDLEQHELDSLVAIHWAVSIFTSTFALGAYGLDAASSQIIPAMKKSAKEEEKEDG